MIYETINTLAALVAFANYQQSQTIPDTPTCRSCQIVIGPTRLSIADTSASAPELMGFFATIGGRYLVAARRGAPQAFDKNGRFLRSLGRTGSGPGEFISSTAIAPGPGDSVVVYDEGNGRFQLFDSQFRFVRTFTLQQTVVNGGMLWLPRSNLFAASGVRPSPEAIGSTIHLYSNDGSYRRSIAESTAPTLPGLFATSQSFRLLQALPNDELVSVSFSGTYSIEIWHVPSGQLRRRWIRESKWFGVEAGPFRSRVVSAQIDSAGLLWTLISNPSPDWEKGTRARVIGSGRRTETIYEIVNRDLISDTAIEVIDLRTGQLVAQARFDKLYPALLPNGLLATESNTPSGFDLVAVGLKRP